ncbi:MAG: sigma-70 family RNA polymerase sigma factor [Hydrococcus sp. SU_1_0]|nr:sigma-70 family RNA polymerase sigma factor [Hydrococcus sp. SU_1_0]
MKTRIRGIREIITLKFNLNNEINPPTLNEISRRLGLKAENVRSRCSRAINSLRKAWKL